MKQPGVVGGVCTAHAPQLWTLPDSEDPMIVDRMRALLSGVGAKLRALEPDVVLLIANDHANQFLLHCVPPFTIHTGGEAKGSFAGRDYRFPVASDAALALTRYLHRNGFDPAVTSSATLDYAFAIPMDFCGMSGPIIPVFVNAYVPPQPTMERCHAFGRAMAEGIRAIGLRAVVVCSGGLSHYPGTERYVEPGPDTAFDRRFMAHMEAGETRYLLALDEQRLDDTGNIELRCWGVSLGAIGDRRPDLTNFEPTWHHNYGTVAWTSAPPGDSFAPHYPAIRADRVRLSETLHRLANDKAECARYVADPAAYAAAVPGLDERERRALISLDQGEMIAMGLHPFVPHAFRRVLERMGLREAPAPGKK